MLLGVGAEKSSSRLKSKSPCVTLMPCNGADCDKSKSRPWSLSAPKSRSSASGAVLGNASRSKSTTAFSGACVAAKSLGTAASCALKGLSAVLPSSSSSRKSGFGSVESKALRSLVACDYRR